MPAPLLLAAVPTIIQAAKDLIDRYVPDKTAAQAAKAALDKQESTEHFEIALRQIDTNIAEIQAGGWLGKWRGALGWGLTLSAIYQLILVHFITFVVLGFDPQYPVEKLPKLDWQELGKLLLGMLGLA